MVQINARTKWGRKISLAPYSLFIAFTLAILLFVISLTAENDLSITNTASSGMIGFDSPSVENNSVAKRKDLAGGSQNHGASGGGGILSSHVIMKHLHTKQADNVWRDLLLEAEHMSKVENNSSPRLHIMEVGMHSPRQCLDVAKRNLHAHCIEPSPSSIARIHRGISQNLYDVKKNIRFYQLAASDISGLELEFKSDGSTGDHVGGGNMNMWTMTKEKNPTGSNPSHEKTVMVKSVALDHVIDNKVDPTIDYALLKSDSDASNSTVKSRSARDNIDKLFLLKIDTQGHEPNVFAGLKKSIQERKIDFIMTEYWPKGMDFMNDSMGPTTECKKSVGILELLYNAGYTLYTLETLFHPKAPKNAATIAVSESNRGTKVHFPTDDFMAHCMWFYELERDPKYRDDVNDEYKMGYWTDILAISPNASIGTTPVSQSGKIVAEHLKLLHSANKG